MGSLQKQDRLGRAGERDAMSWPCLLAALKFRKHLFVLQNGRLYVSRSVVARPFCSIRLDVLAALLFFDEKKNKMRNMFSFFREQEKEKRKKTKQSKLIASTGRTDRNFIVKSKANLAARQFSLGQRLYAPDLIRTRSNESVPTKLSRCAIIDLLQQQDLQVTLHSLLFLGSSPTKHWFDVVLILFTMMKCIMYYKIHEQWWRPGFLLRKIVMPARRR
jgi:hypothetical protein